MDRRALLRGGLVLAGGLVIGRPSGYPSSVAEIRQAAQDLKRADMASGGGPALFRAVNMATGAAGLLDARPSPGRAEATGWLAANAAFMAFDAGKRATATGLYGTALDAARASGNESLQARILGSMARQAIWFDEPMKALELLRQAQALADLRPVERAMLWSLAARAEALAGNARAVDQAAAEADDAIDRGGDVSERPWVGHYDWPHQHGDLAAAYATLSLVHGRRSVTEASGRYDAALSQQGAARSRAMQLADLATVDVAVGDFEYGLTAGWAAADAASGVLSWRLAQGFRQLSGALARHPGSRNARLLADRIRPLVA